MLGSVRRLALHGVWLLVVLTLLASAERRIAVYSDWPGAEPSIEDGNGLNGEWVFQALLLIDDAKPPEARLFLLELFRQELAPNSIFVLLPRKAASRSPPFITFVSAGQRTT